jgi:hypothetical protein
LEVEWICTYKVFQRKCLMNNGKVIFLKHSKIQFLVVIMRNLRVLSDMRHWHRSYRTLNFLWLFSVSSSNYTLWDLFWKDLEGFCASKQSSRYLIIFLMKIFRMLI